MPLQLIRRVCREPHLARMPDSNPITRLNAALEGRYRIGRELGEGGMAGEKRERSRGLGPRHADREFCLRRLPDEAGA